jgi:PAS domain S-box-containing protein
VVREVPEQFVDQGTGEIRYRGRIIVPGLFQPQEIRLRTSRPYDGDWRHRCKDGTTVWTTVATSPVLHDGRDARLSIVHDLTAQREADARTRAIVDNAADAILTIDLDGHIESVNPAAQRMFGRGAGEIVGAPVANLMTSSDGRPLDGGVFGFGREVIGVRGDGSSFPLELAVTEVELGDRTVSTVIARDITDRKAL